MHWVFGYGSNMHMGDLRRWLDQQGIAAAQPARAEPARIAGFELAWHYFSPARGGGAADVRPRRGAVLLGVALHVDEGLLSAIDRKEGHPQRYHRGEAPVAAELLRSGSSVDAWLYRVLPAFRSPGFVAPRAEYLELMRGAAAEHGLGEDYLSALASIPTAE